jgi:hypothetical protein
MKIENTSQNSVSISTHSGIHRMDTIAPSISISSSASTPVAGTPAYKYTNGIENNPHIKKSIITTPMHTAKSPRYAVSTKSHNVSIPPEHFSEAGYGEGDDDDDMVGNKLQSSLSQILSMEDSSVATSNTKSTFRDHISVD